MPKIKVSVIIPIYNTEKYLRRCVDSALVQTLSDIEVILVDDGSPDGCGAICDGYAASDSRVKVFHKENGGASSARNLGLATAEGEYVFFLDSDDRIDEDGLERLYEIASQNKTDFVRFRPIRSGWPGLPDEAPCYYEKERELRDGYYSREDIEKEVLPRILATSALTLGALVSASTAMYKTAFLKEHGIAFDTSLKACEDMFFNAHVARCASSFYYVGKAGIYHYFYNRGSASKGARTDYFDRLKKLYAACERDFAGIDDGRYDRQLMYLRALVILSAVGEGRTLRDRGERKKYCASVVRDSFVKNARLKLSLLDVPFKTKCLILLAKLGLSSLLSAV